LPGQLAALKGFKFSENTPSTALREIFLEEIYNVDGYINNLPPLSLKKGKS